MGMIPRNELELIVLFAQECATNPDIEIISMDGTFPDATVRWKEENYRVEFEYKAHNFWLHGHNPVECDLVICWENNDPYLVLPVIALSEPDWMSKGIELTRAVEKSVIYWKRRALEAEKELISQATAFENISEDSLEDSPIEIELPIQRAKDDRIRELLLEGRSDREIALEIWNKVHLSGDNFYKVRSIKNGLNGQLDSSWPS